MRVLILGADGMLGHVVCATLSRAHDLFGTCRGRLTPSPWHGAGRCFELVQAGDEGRLREVLHELRPDVAVNCIGLVKQRAGAADAAAMHAVNALLPQRLAAIADAVGTKLIQISTDCVFSGRRGGYRSDDAPDPIDAYGRSKLLGEVVRAPHLTLRTSLFGRQLRGSHGLLEWFLAQPPGPVRGFVRAVFSGLSTAAFAGVLERLLHCRPELTGIYHVAAAPISKHELLCRLRARLALPHAIVPDAEVCCDRSLDGSAFTHATSIAAPSWDVMIEQVAVSAPLYDAWRESA